MAKTCIVIPARYESTRFPGKLLKTINELSILQHVYAACTNSNLISKVIIATDHELIRKHCIENDMDFMMTSKHHISGTDRVAEVMTKLNSEFDYVINVQGDEPMITAKEINTLMALLIAKSADIATLYRSIPFQKINNPDIVKLVHDINKRVLYFSRSTIPYLRQDGEMSTLKQHLGIYGFKTKVINQIKDIGSSGLERSEMLEQLRWQENGYEIFTTEVDYLGFGIDTPEDLIRAKAIMEM